MDFSAGNNRGRQICRHSQRYTPEKIINKLRQAEVLLAQGRSIREVAEELAISDHTCYRRRREYGGIRTDQAKRLKMLEKENDRLKKLVADLSLDNAILKGWSGRKLVSPARRRAAVERAMEGHRVSERRVPGA
jgi:putative transposase